MYAATFRVSEETHPPDRSHCFDSTLPFVVIVVVSLCCFTVFTIAAQDISNQRDELMDAIRAKRYIDALKMQKDVLERENKEKSEFIAIASHEMRTPLHAIAGFTELLAQSKLDDEQKENLRLARQSVKVLEFVVDNVLNYTRLLNKTVNVNERWCVLSEIIYDVMISLSVIIENPISVLFVNENEKKTREKCDVHLIIQIVQNLISNAYKFTNSGSVVVRYKTFDGLCRIVVQDTGVGITSDKLSTIFLPFSQEDKRLSRKYTGTGLGLAISDHVAKILHGDISVSSNLGQGSVFSLLIPMEYEEDGPIFDTHIRGIFHIDGFEQGDILKITLEQQLLRFGLQQDVYQIPGSSTDVEVFWNRKEDGSQEVMVKVGTASINKQFKKTANVLDIFSALRDILDGQFRRKVETSQPVIVQESVKEKEVEGQKGNGLILVAEDNFINQALIKKQLTRLNYNCEIVANGQECLDKIVEGRKYCCILMDCQMPVMDGFEAARRIREINTSIPILALTANVSDLSRAESERVGMNAFLSKPLKMEDLKTALLMHCNSAVRDS